MIIRSSFLCWFGMAEKATCDSIQNIPSLSPIIWLCCSIPSLYTFGFKCCSNLQGVNPFHEPYPQIPGLLLFSISSSIAWLPLSIQGEQGPAAFPWEKGRSSPAQQHSELSGNCSSPRPCHCYPVPGRVCWSSASREKHTLLANHNSLYHPETKHKLTNA